MSGYLVVASGCLVWLSGPAVLWFFRSLPVVQWSSRSVFPLSGCPDVRLSDCRARCPMLSGRPVVQEQIFLLTSKMVNENTVNINNLIVDFGHNH